ncbi:carboxypeptidase-like regulatory domain-containing protein [Natronincola ferrireducens]|uniref:Carboxypeptidase regulatory-like domain-containing protein n=1 Tax=Natronincola ferrireducens TaxID=393762 RepID=A0A1G8ZF91_9FIRM|nr:carboxypeptidase-like regulatory domain-containing protein [Natronincola ferrireducens]SDK13786.1 hypothetical protein SAMN05660472_00844 [Natronincola ferrireducens]
MKKILRVKVKDLLKAISVFLSVLLLAYIFLPTIMLSIGERYDRNGNPLTAKIYYERLDRFFPKASETATALERMAEITANHNLLMISSAGVGSAPHMVAHLSQESKVYYEKLVKRFPDTWQGKRATTQLTKQAIRDKVYENKIEEAFEVMENYYETINANTRYNYWDASVALTLAATLRSQGFYDEGLRILDYIMEHQGDVINTDVYEVAAEFHRFLGNKEEAEKYYSLLLQEYKDIMEIERHHWSDSDMGGINSYYDEKTKEIVMKLASLQNRPMKHGEVTGSVTLRGEAFPNLQVFLQPQNFPRGGVIFGGSTDDALWTTSDKNGEFTFSHVLPGRYSIGFIVDLDVVEDVVLKGGFFPESTILVDEEQSYHRDFHLVDTLKVLSPVENYRVTGDTLHFQWEAFEDASYYTLELGTYSLNGGGTYSTPYSERKFYTNEALLSVDELTYIQTGMAFDDEGPTPDSLLAFAHPKGKYFWGIRAHDEEGNIITTSRGYLKGQNTDFHFTGRDLRKGDELLLARDYQGAIDAYEEDVSKNPKDIYPLAMLGKLYSISWNDTYPHTDLDKALAYYEELYAITENPSFLDRSFFIQYYQKKDYHQALAVLKILEEKNALHLWHRQNFIMIDIHLGNYEGALQELLQTDFKEDNIETSLRIITNNFDNLKSTEKPSEEVRGLTAIEEYRNNYSSLDMELKKKIQQKKPLDALKLLENPELTAHQTLIKLSLKVMEPSISVHEYEEIQNFVNAYSSTDPDLTQLVQRLFMVPIY